MEIFHGNRFSLKATATGLSARFIYIGTQESSQRLRIFHHFVNLDPPLFRVWKNTPFCLTPESSIYVRSNGHLPTVQWLVQNGADLTAQNNHGPQKMDIPQVGPETARKLE